VTGEGSVPHNTGNVVSRRTAHRQRDGPRWAGLGSVGQAWTGAGASVPGRVGGPWRPLPGRGGGLFHVAHGAQAARAGEPGIVDPSCARLTATGPLAPRRTPGLLLGRGGGLIHAAKGAQAARRWGLGICTQTRANAAIRGSDAGSTPAADALARPVGHSRA
jgi:hypothetical protein